MLTQRMGHVVFIPYRVMDAFLVDAMEIIFRLAVAILTFGKEDLLSLDMEGMLKVCNSHFYELILFEFLIDLLFFLFVYAVFPERCARSVRLLSGYALYGRLCCQIQRQEDEKVGKGLYCYQDQRAGGSRRSSGTSKLPLKMKLFFTNWFLKSLQRLRAENRMLRQKASMLETESSELAERLVRGQVSRADQEETTFHLKRELEACRQRDAENTARIAELQQRLKHMEEVRRLKSTDCLAV